MNRLFLGKPLDDAALQSNSDLMSPDEFAEDMKEALDSWVANMRSIGYMHKDFPEKKMESFLAWAEFNTENDESI